MSIEIEASDLSSCPFCGSLDISEYKGLHFAFVDCANCGARGPTIIIQSGQSAKVEWNKRKETI